MKEVTDRVILSALIAWPASNLYDLFAFEFSSAVFP